MSGEVITRVMGANLGGSVAARAAAGHLAEPYGDHIFSA